MDKVRIAWDFLQSEILGMGWLQRLTGAALEKCGMDISGRLGGSVHFFVYDTIKIMVLLGVLILGISYIQSFSPPERTKKILGGFHGLGANLAAALGLSAEVEYITDMEEILRYGVMRTPALVVNGKLVAMGRVLKAEEAAALLRKIEE